MKRKFFNKTQYSGNKSTFIPTVHVKLNATDFVTFILDGVFIYCITLK